VIPHPVRHRRGQLSKASVVVVGAGRGSREGGNSRGLAAPAKYEFGGAILNPCTSTIRVPSAYLNQCVNVDVIRYCVERLPFDLRSARA
jgi:hypothetical protein